MEGLLQRKQCHQGPNLQVQGVVQGHQDGEGYERLLEGRLRGREDDDVRTSRHAADHAPDDPSRHAADDPPVTPPATPKTPEAPKVAVQKAAVQRQAVVAKAAVPKTSDSTNLAGAGILAGLAVAFGAAGIVLRRRARKLD